MGVMGVEIQMLTPFSKKREWGGERMGLASWQVLSHSGQERPSEVQPLSRVTELGRGSCRDNDCTRHCLG